MGAIAPATPWIPEDDYLLKNAVEAGASLESLAKGAVQFSRRYTIRELQDRWYCLLYDPIISAESSAHMIEFERSNSNPSSKSSRLENFKERKGGRKRRVSVRSCYYAWRKRFRTEPLSQSDLNFLVPGPDCCGNGNDAPECNNILEDPVGNHFALAETNFDNLHHCFPQVGNIGGPSHEFKSGPPSQLGSLPIDAHDMSEEMPHVLDNSMNLGGRCTAVGTVDPSKEHPMPNIFEDGNMNVNPMSRGSDTMCTEFGGNHIFNSPISDCDTSFHHLQHSSPPPAMPDWRNMEGMGSGSGLGGKDQQTGDAFEIQNNGHVEHRTSEYNAVHHEDEFRDHVSCGDLETPCEQIDLAELSNSLLNFSEDEIIFMDEDGKDAIDKSYMDGLSLLLDSPADVNEDEMMDTNEDEMVDVTEVEAPVAQETNMVMSNSSGSGHLHDSAENDFRDRTLTANPEENIASVASGMNPQFPEYRNGVICCTLNTEDSEIPCNDDIILPSKFSLAPTHRRDSSEANHPSSSSFKGILHKDTSEIVLSPLSRELKRFGELHGDSLTKGQETGFEDSVDPCGARLDGNGTGSWHHNMASQSNVNPKKESSDVGTSKQSGPNLGCMSGQISDGLNSHFQKSGGVIKQEGQEIISAKQPELHVQLVSTDTIGPEPGEESMLSDPEEVVSEDDDIPCFSDVESLILGMDLDVDPEDQESFAHREVAKYMQEAAQRAIIRLEQAANASIQRATASRGAFAVLTSHHSKHYIKKAEVLLGRATEDVIVDIDLGREVRANKISRRQAIIKLGKDGTFCLTNLGKSSIFVNNNEVQRNQSFNLQSNCLIEIRGMPFTFETNPTYVKRYLDSVSAKLAPGDNKL